MRTILVRVEQTKKSNKFRTQQNKTVKEEGRDISLRSFSLN